MKNNELKKLLDNTTESYYWIGFLMADGHFSKTNRLLVNLALKDKNHLEKLGAYINVPVVETSSKIGDKVYQQVRLAVMDNKVIKNIKQKFGIASNKTTNPPILDIKDEELLFA